MWVAHFSPHDSTDGQCVTSANLVLEEVEGVWLGAAVTPFPVPMTALDFPSELLKEGVGCRRVSLCRSAWPVRLSED